MKVLVLAYGAEADWNAISESEQNTLLEADAVMRGRGDLVAAVRSEVRTVRTGARGTTEVSVGSFATSAKPLAGFGIIEARDWDEAVSLVSQTPCARTNGAVELRMLLDTGQ